MPQDILLFCMVSPKMTAEAVSAIVDGLKVELNGALQTAMLMPTEALPALAHAAEPSPDLPDLILTLPDFQVGDQAQLNSIIQKLSQVADIKVQSLLIAERHAVLPGDDAIRLFFGLRRLKRLTLGEFHDYWLNKHADMGRRLIPPYSYHQLHADPIQTQEAAETLGLTASDYDGIVEVHFPDVDAFIRQLSRKEVAEEALADEKNFIDHARSIFWAYQTL